MILMCPMKLRWCSIAQRTLRSHPMSKTHKLSNLQSPLWTWAAIRPRSNTLLTFRMDHLLCKSVMECRPWRNDKQAHHLSMRARGKLTWIKLTEIEWRCLKSAPRSSKTLAKTLVWNLLRKVEVYYVARRLSVLRSSSWGISWNKWKITKSSKGS